MLFSLPDQFDSPKLNMLNEAKEPLPVTEWTSEVKASKYGYKHFI